MKTIYKSKNINNIICIILLTMITFVSCNKESYIQGEFGTVTDIDGNVYQTVIIGTQVWMVENLKVTHYRNGDSIMYKNSNWPSFPAYCDYNFTPSYSITYDRLYNFYAVVDNRKLCPLGWHVPSDAEWTTLTTYFGGESIAGGKLKEAGLTHWLSPNTGATNETGFTALPSGYLGVNGNFMGTLGYYGWFWSSTKYSSNSWYRSMISSSGNVSRNTADEKCFLSVRCIKD